MKTILIFGTDTFVEAVIRRTLASRGLKLRPMPEPLGAIGFPVCHPPGRGFVIAASEPGERVGAVSLLLEPRPEAAILVVLYPNAYRRMRSLLPLAAATLEWPFFVGSSRGHHAIAGRRKCSLNMNDSALKLDSNAIERKLRDDEYSGEAER